MVLVFLLADGATARLPPAREALTDAVANIDIRLQLVIEAEELFSREGYHPTSGKFTRSEHVELYSLLPVPTHVSAKLHFTLK